MNFMDELVDQNGFFKGCKVNFAVETDDEGEVNSVSALLTEFESNALKELLFTEMTTFMSDAREHLARAIAWDEGEVFVEALQKEAIAQVPSYADLEDCAEEYGDALHPNLAIELRGDAINFLRGGKIEIYIFEDSASFMPRELKYDTELGCLYRAVKEYALELTDDEVQKLCETVANEVFDAVQADEKLSITTDVDVTAKEMYDFIKSCSYTARQDVQKSNDREIG